nr:MAG TPA: hypothetical protein [Caudoviricetes sp.]
MKNIGIKLYSSKCISNIYIYIYIYYFFVIINK